MSVVSDTVSIHPVATDLIIMTKLCTLLTILLPCCQCLILREVSVPAYIISGEDTVLGCHYDAQVFMVV